MENCEISSLKFVDFHHWNSRIFIIEIPEFSSLKFLNFHHWNSEFSSLKFLNFHWNLCIFIDFVDFHWTPCHELLETLCVWNIPVHSCVSTERVYGAPYELSVELSYLLTGWATYWLTVCRLCSLYLDHDDTSPDLLCQDKIKLASAEVKFSKLHSEILKIT